MTSLSVNKWYIMLVHPRQIIHIIDVGGSQGVEILVRVNHRLCTADFRLQTRSKMKTEGKMKTANCIL